MRDWVESNLESRNPVSFPGRASHRIRRKQYQRSPVDGPSRCNTLGVCHQLRNGFELEHGILSDDEYVKVQPIETSPNLNLDIAPLLAYRPLFKIYAWVVLLEYLHESHINTHLYWSMEKFCEVWNQEVTWNDELCPCLNEFRKWMEFSIVNQILQPCPNDSRWTLQQKSWRVHVERRTRKYLVMKGSCWAEDN